MQFLKAGKYVLILVIFTFYTLEGWAQRTISVPPEFVETPLPDKNGWSAERAALNHSKHNFQVNNVNGKLLITPTIFSNTTELKVLTGKVIGVNYGEGVGQLSFQHANPAEKPGVVKTGRIKFLFRWKGEVYFIESFAHMMINEGALFRLDTTDNSLTYTKLLELGDAPAAMTIYKDDLLIAASRGIYMIRNNKKEVIIEDANWTGIFPYSIAAFNDNNVIIGMRGGISKLDLLTKTLKFYKYKE